jgi:hypothetical protein
LFIPRTAADEFEKKRQYLINMTPFRRKLSLVLCWITLVGSVGAFIGGADLAANDSEMFVAGLWIWITALTSFYCALTLRGIILREPERMNPKQFVEKLTLSKLLTEQQIAELLHAFRVEQKESRNDKDAVNQFGEFLVSTGSITEWQCNKLKAGKWKGFLLDDYLLLDNVGKDQTTVSYKARDISDGSIVRLVVSPFNQAVGKTEYRVERNIE